MLRSCSQAEFGLAMGEFLKRKYVTVSKSTQEGRRAVEKTHFSLQ